MVAPIPAARIDGSRQLTGRLTVNRSAAHSALRSGTSARVSGWCRTISRVCSTSRVASASVADSTSRRRLGSPASSQAQNWATRVDLPALRNAISSNRRSPVRTQRSSQRAMAM